jgi:hypothetical protein
VFAVVLLTGFAVTPVLVEVTPFSADAEVRPFAVTRATAATIAIIANVVVFRFIESLIKTYSLYEVGSTIS